MDFSSTDAGEADAARSKLERYETFLLIHGIPGWRGTWRSLATELGHTARVVVPVPANITRTNMTMMVC